MNVIITIQHPAHVHFFKNCIWELTQKGHHIDVVAREKELITELLVAYDIPYTILAGKPTSMVGTVKCQLAYEYNLLQRSRRFNPDVMVAIGEPGVAHVSKLVDARSILFSDTEHNTFQKRISFPLADRICTPKNYRIDVGRNQVRYPGYHELAYLHPNRFNPDPTRLNEYDVDPTDRYVVLRFIGWEAFHDWGKVGLSFGAKKRLIAEVSTHSKVYITSETALPREFEKYRLPVPPHLVHHLLYFANGYIGDSGTMATEAAILGIPSVRADPFAAGDDGGNFVELENDYGLMFSTSDENEAIETFTQLMARERVDEVWQRRRQKLLLDKIDVTTWMIDQIQQIGEPT